MASAKPRVSRNPPGAAVLRADSPENSGLASAPGGDAAAGRLDA